jgi:hypothetical protein
LLLAKDLKELNLCIGIYYFLQIFKLFQILAIALLLRLFAFSEIEFSGVFLFWRWLFLNWFKIKLFSACEIINLVVIRYCFVGQRLDISFLFVCYSLDERLIRPSESGGDDGFIFVHLGIVLIRLCKLFCLASVHKITPLKITSAFLYF